MGVSSLSTKHLIACVAIIVAIYLKSPANSTIHQISCMSFSEIYESQGWAWEREWLGVRHSSIRMPTLPLMYSVTHLLICKIGNMCWQYMLQKIIWWSLERTLCKAPPGPMCVSRSVVSDSCDPHRLHPSSFLCPWDPPGKNTGGGCRLFLQGIFPTQGSNPGLLHCRQILYHLSHQGSRNAAGKVVVVI